MVLKSLVPSPLKTRTQTSIKAPEAQNRIKHLRADSLALVKRVNQQIWTYLYFSQTWEVILTLVGMASLQYFCQEGPMDGGAW